MVPQLSLCTYSVGSVMVREVLDDWFEFLGGKPERVIFAVSPQGNVPAIYDELHAEHLIDELHPIESRGRSVQEIDAEAIRAAITAATTEWVLLIKLDTLPYRCGHDDWLERCMTEIRARNFFGMTGAFRPNDSKPIAPGFSSTQKYSNNFAIFRREDWLRIVPNGLGEISEVAVGGERFSRDDLRFATEAAIELYLRETGGRMLTRNEDRDWSVFHVNVWGEKLRQVRSRYRERKGIGPFLDTGYPPHPPQVHPWQWWYGTPPPSLLKRARIWLGSKRRQIMEQTAPSM